MNKPTLVGAACLLLAGAVALVFLNQPKDEPAESTAVRDRKSGTAGSSGFSPSDAATRGNKSRQRDPAENAELVAKYGQARTQLSKQIATNVVGLMEEGIEMGEMAINGQLANAFGGRRGMAGMALAGLPQELNLSEEQRDQAATLVEGYQQREIARSKEAAERLKQDPTALMELMLAGDAHTRGKMSDEELNQLRQTAGNDLTGMLNPLDRNNLRGQPLQDQQFSSEFEALLSPEQAEVYRNSRSNQDSAGDAGPGIGSMPSMELEKLDEAVSSMKQMTSGMKQMMQGMGGLQNLGPLMEQQRGN